MIVNTPDGQVNFPDSMSDDDVKGVLQKKYGAPKPDVPLFSLTGPDKVGEFFGKAGDAATFGLGAKAQDALGIAQGPHGETVAQQVEAAGKDIGPIASAGADVLGYAAGPGMAGVGAGLGKLATSGLARGVGENVASRVGGRMIGSGIEGTGATILGAAGHDQDLTTGELLKSAVISTATGALPGGAGKRPTTPSSADLGQTSQDAFSVLGKRQYNSPGVVKTFENLKANIPQGLEANMSPSLGAKIDDLQRIAAKKGTVSDDTIASFQRALRDAGENKTDQKIIKTFNDTLNQAVGPQAAADIGAANRASSIAQTGADIEGWAAAPSKAPAAIQSALEKRPNLYKTQPGLFEALSAIGKKSEDPSLLAKLRDFTVRSAVGGGLGYGAGYLLGGNPGQTAVEGAMTGVVAPHVIKAAGSIPIRNSLLAAQHLNATGMKVDPSVYTSMGLQVPGMLARQTGYGLGAGGVF